MPNFPPYAKFSEYSIVLPSELTGVLAPNNRLDGAEVLFAGQLKGPECFDSYDGALYTGLHGGYIVKIVGNQLVPIVRFGKPCAGIWEEEKCGRPLGLRFNKKGVLYVSDPYYGIFEVDVNTGNYKKIVDITQPIEGIAPKIANSLDVASNGDIYWTDSSTEFSLYDGIYTFLANPSGRLIRYNAATKRNEVLMNNLAFANGVKLSEDESFVIVSESVASRITKYNLKGPKAGRSEPFIQGLPGIPDNIHSDGRDGFLVSLYTTIDPQHPQILQSLMPHPYIRKMCARFLSLLETPFKLLEDVYPSYYSKRIVHWIGNFESIRFMIKHKGVVLRLDKNGNILDSLHPTNDKISTISSAYIHKNYLWIGSPFHESIVRVPLKLAFPNSDISEERPFKDPKKSKVSDTIDTSKKPSVTVTPPKPPVTTTSTPRTTTTTTTPTPRTTATTPTPRTTTTTTPTPRPATTTTPTPRTTTTTPTPRTITTTPTPRPTTTTTPTPRTTTTTTPIPTTKPDATKKPTAQTSKTTASTTSKPTITTSSSDNSKLPSEATKASKIIPPPKTGVNSMVITERPVRNDAVKQSDTKDAKGTPPKQVKQTENDIPVQK